MTATTITIAVTTTKQGVRKEESKKSQTSNMTVRVTQQRKERKR